MKAFALVRFHFFSAAAFYEINVSVNFLFSMRADPLGNHALKSEAGIVVTMKLKERSTIVTGKKWRLLIGQLWGKVLGQ